MGGREVVLGFVVKWGSPWIVWIDDECLRLCLGGGERGWWWGRAMHIARC